MAYGLQFINENGHPLADYDASQVQIYKTLYNIQPGTIAHAASNTIADHGDSSDSSYKGALPIVLPQNIDREEVFIFVAAADVSNWSRSFSVGVHYGVLSDTRYDVATTSNYQGQNYVDVTPGPTNFGATGSAEHEPEDYSGTAGLGNPRPCSDNRGSGTKLDAPDPVPRDLIGATITATFLPAGSATVTNVAESTFNNNPIIRLYLNKNVSTSGSLLNTGVFFSDFNCFYLCDSAFKTAGSFSEKFKIKIGMLNDKDDQSEANDYGIRIRNQYGSTNQNVFNFSTNREMFTGTSVSNTRTDQVVEFSSNNVLQTNYTPSHHQDTAFGNFEDTYVLMNPCFGCTAAYADNGSVGSYSFSENSDTIVGWSPMITFKPSGYAYAELTTIAFQSFSSTYEPDTVNTNLNQIFMSPGVINSKSNAGLQASISHTWASQRPLLTGKIQ